MVKVTLEASSLTPGEAAIFADFIVKLSGATPAEPVAALVEVPKQQSVTPQHEEPQTTKAEPEAKTRSLKRTGKAQAEPEVEQTQTEENEPGQVTDGFGVAEVKIADIRAIMASKVADNRDAIVSKLKSYGAANVSTLNESHYGDFYTFLLNL